MQIARRPYDCVRCATPCTSQTERMRSSCCRNTSAQPYRGMHIYAPINEYHLTMSAQSEWDKQSMTCADRLLDNHVVIILSAQSGQIICLSNRRSAETHFVYLVLSN